MRFWPPLPSPMSHDILGSQSAENHMLTLEEKRLRETARKRRQRAKWTPEQWAAHRERALRNYYERKARRLAQQAEVVTE